MLVSLVLAAPLLNAASLAMSPGETPAASEDPLADAKAMYKRGSAEFAATNYVRAIEIWTQLLAELPNGEEFAPIQLDLLYNIAVAHVREYEFDHERRHLQQALALFERYAGDDPDDETKDKIAEVERMLSAHEEREAESAALPPDDRGGDAGDSGQGARADTSTPKWMRGAGIGLVSGGGAATVGGVVLLVLGSRFRPSAEAQLQELDDANVPADDPIRDDADAFVQEETRRGRNLMIAGGVVAGVGVAAVGVGIWALVKARPGREAEVALTIGPRGLGLRGRF